MGTLRKILRSAFYAAAAVSMLLLLGTVILWPKSYYRQVAARYGLDKDHGVLFGTESGRAYLFYDEIFGSMPGLGMKIFPVGSGNENQWNYATWNTPGGKLGSGAENSHTYVGILLFYFPSFKFGFIYIPLSYFALLFSILPLLAFRSIRRRRKARRASRIGLCPKCGYDLRAHSAPGSVCPECGTPVASAPTSA